MREDRIDIQTDDATIEAFLQASLHSNPGCSEGSSENMPDQCLPHNCSTDPAMQFANKWVISLHHCLGERKLLPGTLLHFSSSVSNESHACVLGVCLKKPIVQTLLHVTFESNGDIIFKRDQNSVAKVTTSHCLLKQFYHENDQGDSTDTKINVQVWNYKLKWVDGHALIACAEGVRDEFTISSEKVAATRKVKRKIVLPFGLTFSRPKRKQHSRPKRQNPKAKAASSKPSPPASDPDAKTDSGASSASSADSDSDTANDREDDGQDGDGLDIEAECDEVIPISETVIQEQTAAAEVAREIESADQQWGELAQECKKTTCVQKSFFSKDVGLDHGAIAVSGRSICLNCKTTIPKGTVRFAWNYNTLRPHGWLHNSCLYDYVTRNGVTEPTVGKLQAIVNSGSSSSGGEVQVEAAKILALLQS